VRDDIQNAPAPQGSLLTQVQRVIEAELPAGNPYSENVARTLGMSERTLRRRLKQEGASFQQTLDRVRHQLAERLLRIEALTLKETTFRLGFSDVSAFRKAYRRWTGFAPRADGFASG